MNVKNLSAALCQTVLLASLKLKRLIRCGKNRATAICRISISRLRRILTPVVEAHANYRASAKFDDEILAKTRVSKIGNSSIKFENEVFLLPEIKLLYGMHSTCHSRSIRMGRQDKLCLSFLSSRV